MSTPQPGDQVTSNATGTDTEEPTDGDVATDQPGDGERSAGAGPDGVGAPEYSPTSVGAAVSVLSALLVTVVLASVSLTGSASAGLGTWTIVVALLRGHRKLVTVGSSLAFGGLLLAGLADAPAPPLLVGAICTLVAYDAGHYSVRLGTQLGPAASTARAEYVHIGVTAVVTTVTALAGYLVFRLGTGGQPAIAVVALLLAVLLLVSALYLTGE